MKLLVFLSQMALLKVNDLRLVEFHSKANALTDASMEIVSAAAEDHGSGIIIHNDAQHFFRWGGP